MPRLRPHRFSWVPFLAAAALAAGCGGSSSSSSSSSTSPAPAATTGGGSGAVATQPGALSADATSAATGDIPDNQQFLTFRSPSAGFSIKYPEGWAQASSGNVVTFRDKNNLVRIVIGNGAAPTPASVAAGLARLKAADPSLKAGRPQAATIKGKRMVKVTYTTRSAPNAVTGKRVTLNVDRYVLARAGKVATVDLGTPIGVDNVDAYKMMVGSFTWL